MIKISGEKSMKRMLLILSFFVWAMETPAYAKIITQTAPYQHQGIKHTGYLAYDDAFQGKRPGVLVVHEWWGLNEYARYRAEKLAGIGYVAFALDMYGEGKVTQNPKEASEWSKQITANARQWQQRARAGLDVLMKDPRADHNRIVAIGYCFGGSTVQQLAYSGAPVKAVVSFHGSLLLPEGSQAGQTMAKMLICHGAADPFIPLNAVQDYISGMKESGLDWQLIIYSGAKHSFTNPGADRAGMEGVGYNKSADERSWRHMEQFFDELLGMN
jgi:dienelactone hydrolase